MKTPDVGNMWSMGTRSFEGKVEGNLDNSNEVMTRAKINGINEKEKEVADKFIKQDNGPNDLDPRKGHVAIANDVDFKSNAHFGFRSVGTEVAKVEYDTTTGTPKEMTRDIDLKDHYSFYSQSHHSTGHSSVKWEKDGSIAELKEERSTHVIGSSGGSYEKIEITKNPDGTLHYKEK